VVVGATCGWRPLAAKEAAFSSAPRARLKKAQPALWSGGHFRARARKPVYDSCGGLRSAGRFNRAAARIAKGSPRPPRMRDHFLGGPQPEVASCAPTWSMRLKEVETSI
jgi:hypothetical protein